MSELIERYPAEAQLIMSALEDGLTLGPMQAMQEGPSVLVTLAGGSSISPKNLISPGRPSPKESTPAKKRRRRTTDSPG